MDSNEQGQQLQIELGEKEAEGIYSNLAIITHSPAEFIIDYTRVTPGVPKARVLSRIIMTPQHMKLLLGAMQENVSRYESQYGEIRVEGQNAHPFGFRTGPVSTPQGGNSGGGEKVH
ncbi:MAG TPA: DUF3467 domain-containing protein [Candidatus Kapabacteria bacterium]|nr:DUF3467 domain-containing protein [Candidatus Kapabacteria bacterium]